MNCARARQRFPDLEAGLSDAAALAHVASCRLCEAELSMFRAVLYAVAGDRDAGVPDPGDEYWSRFLPSVRARLAEPRTTARARAGFPARAAAAALLMAGAAFGALLLPRPATIPDRPVAEASSRLESVLLKRSELAPEVAADMLGADLVLTLDPARVLAVMDETDLAAGLAGDWADERMRAIINGLSLEQAARLQAEIAAENG